MGLIDREDWDLVLRDREETRETEIAAKVVRRLLWAFPLLVWVATLLGLVVAVGNLL